MRFLRIGFMFIPLCVLSTFANADEYYVATDGNDNLNPGTLLAPWGTIQKAVDSMDAGDTAYVRGGTYNERITFVRSGSAQAGYITLSNYEGELPVVDAAGTGNGDVFYAWGKSYIKIIGFEIKNGWAGSGIRFDGTGSHIEIRDCTIHDLGAPADGGSGIAFFGYMSDMLVDGNEIFDCDTTNWEALFVREHGHDFVITNNYVHDNTNIGIDIVSWVASDPPRDGLIKGNISHGNGASHWAAGIYSDGADNLVIEENISYENATGYSLGAEFATDVSENNVLRRNIAYRNTKGGIAIGGYDNQRGVVTNCTIVNNTVYNNGTEFRWIGQIQILKAYGNTIQNNIFYEDIGVVLLGSNGNYGDNQIDYNCWSGTGEFLYRDTQYNSFAQYQAATGRDAHSFLADPQFLDPPDDFHLDPDSPCIDTGTDVGLPYEGDGPDIGRYEHPAEDFCASQPDGTPCQSTDPCLVDSTCLSGLCQGGVPMDCDDDDVCTEDSCVAGTCQHDVIPDCYPDGGVEDAQDAGLPDGTAQDAGDAGVDAGLDAGADTGGDVGDDGSPIADTDDGGSGGCGCAGQSPGRGSCLFWLAVVGLVLRRKH